MNAYAITRRDRVAWRLAWVALWLATPTYRKFLTLAWRRGIADLYVHPPIPGEALGIDGTSDE